MVTSRKPHAVLKAALALPLLALSLTVLGLQLLRVFVATLLFTCKTWSG